MNEWILVSSQSQFILLKFNELLKFICLFVTMLGPWCCTGFSLVAASESYFLVVVRGFLIVMASRVEHRL